MTPELVLDEAVDLRAVGDSPGDAAIALIARELRPAEHVAAEPRPFALVLDRDDDALAVAGAEGAVRRDRRMVDADPRRRLAGHLLEHQRHRHPFRRRVEERDRERRPLAGALAADQRLE